jgi:hypothetical protein
LQNSGDYLLQERVVIFNDFSNMLLATPEIKSFNKYLTNIIKCFPCRGPILLGDLDRGDEFYWYIWTGDPNELGHLQYLHTCEN